MIGLHPPGNRESSRSVSIYGEVLGLFEHTVEVAGAVAGRRKREKTASDSALSVAMERSPWDQQVMAVASMVLAVSVPKGSLFQPRLDHSWCFLVSALVTFPPLDVSHSMSTRS